MKAMKHFIRSPLTNQAYFVCVNVGTQHGHGPARAQRASGDVGQVDAIGGTGGGSGSGGSSKVHGELIRSDGAHVALVMCTVIGIEWGGEVGEVGGD